MAGCGCLTANERTSEGVTTKYTKYTKAELATESWRDRIMGDSVLWFIRIMVLSGFIFVCLVCFVVGGWFDKVFDKVGDKVNDKVGYGLGGPGGLTSGSFI